MIYEIIITAQADTDLRGIYEYIAFELLSPDNAAGQLERLVIRIMYAGRDVDNQLNNYTAM
ncbi:MAG: hypothetical protein ACI4E1_14290 [Lachnospira sp.]